MDNSEANCGSNKIGNVFFLVDSDNEFAASAARKIVEAYKPGAVILLSADEFWAWKECVIRVEV